METIQHVETQIENNQELLSETKERIKQTTAKLSEAQGNVKRIEAEIKDTKEKRQAALARGGDSKGLNDSLKKLESELELEQETVVGLQKFMAELQQEEASLHQKINELPKRISQLRSLELAAQYNSIAEQLTPVVEELNEIFYRLTGNGNRRENAVVFYPKDKGPFMEIPKILYDSDGVGLADYVSRHPGQYHGNLAPEHANFYHWPTHENRLRNK